MTRWSWLLSLLVVPLVLFAAEEYPSPRQSVERMKVPEGFRVRLVAGEPTLKKPIAATTDERGRLWVVESNCYPHWIKDGSPGKDRILILTPQADGSWSSKVFLDNGTNLSGIAVGFGGVWLASVPKIIFLPVKDDQPAGPAVTLLDGFNLHDTKHNVVNSLCWGPDGWLYGLNGIQSRSNLGAPGTPNDQRLKIDCGVWRYHPTRKKVEAYAYGTTNPWGIDWDEHGEMFITNCVIKHAFHVVQGAHFIRMYGQDVNPNTYGLIESCADHIHWGGGDWTTSRGGQGTHSVAGGGHAHAGALVYLGDNWPKEYRNRLLMGNLHGSRLNQDELVRSRSGYVIKHREDFLFANDPWFRPLWLAAAHDGGVYVGDWHDTGECHNYDKTHPSGRIYHVRFGPIVPRPVDLTRATAKHLVDCQTFADEWFVRQSRRILQQRAIAGTLGKDVPGMLRELLNHSATRNRLRALWALHVIGELSEQQTIHCLEDKAPEVRLWAVRLLVDHAETSASAARRLAELARSETDEPVLLALASALQRLPHEQRWPLAEALVARAASAGDSYLPLMIWYGIEQPTFDDPSRAVDLLGKSAIPLVRRHVARRLTADEQPKKLALLATHLVSEKTSNAIRRDVLRGMSDALVGRRSVSAPEGWEGVYRTLGKSSDRAVRDEVTRLSVMFGDRRALTELRRLLTDGKAPTDERSRALDVLLDKRAEGVPDLLRTLLDDPGMRGAALRGLAHYDDPKTPELVLARYASMTEAEKADAISTLASRVRYAQALLGAIEGKRIARGDVTPFVARQIAALKDRSLREKLGKVWGEVRPTGKDKEAELAKYRVFASAEQRKLANLSAGRAVWQKTCANCHVLFGEGGKLGPDLTGSQRKNADYVLTKVLDPGAVVPKEYELTRIVTVTGRVLTGYVKLENDKVLTLQTPTEEVRVLKSDVEERDKQPGSLMPEGQLKTLKDEEIRDLLAYLAAERQVSLPGKN